MAIAIYEIEGNPFVYVTGIGYESGGDFVTVKYDGLSGQELWKRRHDGGDYNNSGSGDDWARAIAVDSSGNAYITGLFDYGGSLPSITTIKYTSEGIEAWDMQYGNGFGKDLHVDYATGDVYVGGYIYGTTTYGDYTAIKYDTNGTQQWASTYVLDTFDLVEAIAVDSSNNVYLTGRSGLSGSYDFLTVKFDDSGNLVWTERFNDSGDQDDEGRAIALYESGPYVYVVGKGFGATSYEDFVTIKYKQ